MPFFHYPQGRAAMPASGIDGLPVPDGVEPSEQRRESLIVFPEEDQ
jgi:hypothetical protein